LVLTLREINTSNKNSSEVGTWNKVTCQAGKSKSLGGGAHWNPINQF
jgi:hypothetical protein